MRLLRLFILATLLSGPVLADTTETTKTETYDLLFRDGTLDDVSRDKSLVYDRHVSNRLLPDTATRDTGRIVLEFGGADAAQANLEFQQDGKYRNLGSFPASVGNPIIMYFVETVVRDMAESAGGSPFYIRNRVKESLIRPAERHDEGDSVDVILRPFDGDPNAARMNGFGDLALTVTMSDEVPGWYRSLSASVPAPDGGAPIYSSTLSFDGMEDSE